LTQCVLQGKRGPAGKAVVMGVLERGDVKEKGKKQEKISQVQTTVVQNTDQKTLQKEVRDRVETGSEIMTDEHAGYMGLEDEYLHQVIKHAEEYVNGHVHTNGIENFWTLLKRTIKGTYTNCEPFHLFRYLDEQSFRFNERGGTDCDRFLNVAASVAGRRLTYKKLTGKTTKLTPAWQV
jgi:hypothetical protein